MNTRCSEKENHSINYAEWGLVRFQFLMILRQNEVLELRTGNNGGKGEVAGGKRKYIEIL